MQHRTAEAGGRNDEIRMTKECRMTKLEWSIDRFVIRASSLIRHSDFVIRHFVGRLLEVRTVRYASRGPSIRLGLK